MTDIISKIDEIKRMLEDKLQRLRISANQIEIVHGISDISKRLGLFQSGELRFGNHVEPGKGFTGLRIGFPAFTYSSVEYVLAFVVNDVLTFGLTLSGQSTITDSTFTPVAVGTIDAGVGTYTVQTGRYSRIGNTVHFTLNLAWTAHTGTGDLTIEGFPIVSNSSVYSTFPVYFRSLTLAAPENKVLSYLDLSGSHLHLQEIGDASTSAIPMDSAVSYLMISGTYFTD